MAKRGTSVFRNPVKETATPTTPKNLTALQANFQSKWGTEGRPSPRTGTTGAGITKFGTQQLKFVEPPKLGTPYQGVIEVDTGANFRLGLQSFVASQGIDFGKATTFSKNYQQKRPETIKTYEQLATSPHAPPPPSGNPLDPITWLTFDDDIPTHTDPDKKDCDLGCYLTGRGCDCHGDKNGNGNGNGNGRCTLDDIENGGDPSCGVKEFFAGVPAGTFCKCSNWFGWDELDKHGCECEACKNGTGQCSDKCGKCDAWDVACEAGCATEGIIDDECGFLGISCMLGDWWDKYGIYVIIAGGLIGLGILLYLLKPLFNMIGAFKGGSP